MYFKSNVTIKSPKYSLASFSSEALEYGDVGNIFYPFPRRRIECNNKMTEQKEILRP